MLQKTKHLVVLGSQVCQWKQGPPPYRQGCWTLGGQVPLTRRPLEEPGFEHWLSLTPKLAFLPLCHRELVQYVPIP